MTRLSFYLVTFCGIFIILAWLLGVLYARQARREWQRLQAEDVFAEPWDPAQLQAWTQQAGMAPSPHRRKGKPAGYWQQI